MMSSPTVRVRGTLAEALAPSLLGGVDETALRRWLMSRRWFAAKGREPTQVRVTNVIPLPWGGEAGGEAIAVISVDPGDGRIQRYQLPLAVLPREAVPADELPLCEIETDRERGVLVDATSDPGFRRRLAEAFRSGARFGDAGARWIVEPIGGEGIALDADETRVVRGEQSNTSIIFGDRAILKLFRRLEPGINPDVELGRFLTMRARFPHTPQLLGTITLATGHEEPAVAGMLQRFLPGSRDAWEYALERLGIFLRGGGPPFTEEAVELGRITRELHEALSSDAESRDFAPEEASADDVRSWAAASVHAAERALTLLESRTGALAPGDRESADRVLAQRRELMVRIESAADQARNDAGWRIRHHGDFHLGQVLRTGQGEFVIIDFEGEPSRSLAARRAKQSPLRDVAGMLRSFAYAAAVGAVESPANDAHVRAAAWERDGRAAFLASYLERIPDAGRLLPRSDQAVRALISLFEVEKVCYELGYELDNRPDWAWIPLRGIERELRSSTTSEAV